MGANDWGVYIENGVTDWQIVQQDRRGMGAIEVSGRWAGYLPKEAPAVWVRLVREDSGAPVAAHLDWHAVPTSRKGTWRAALHGIPCGGLYRLETQLRNRLVQCPEWSLRGDARHFLGVGDLWIVAGQSNSAGYGKGHVYDPPEPGLHMLSNAMRWGLACQPMNDSTDTVHVENREFVNSGHSPWLHWARLVKQAVNHPIGLLQCSLGGSVLQAWSPEGEGEHPLYALMLRVARSAGGRVRGVLWYQGCSDGDATRSVDYQRRFANAVKAWRKDLGDPQMPLITVQINRVTGASSEEKDRAWSRIREAQRQAARRIPNVAVVPTLDLPLSDFIHTAPVGNLLLAERAASATLATVYGRSLNWRAPEAEAARMMANNVVELRFSGVVGRFRSTCEEIPFVVEDRDGRVPVRRVEYTVEPVVRLHLERAVQGQGVVHGAFGADPAPVPLDMTRNMPMLGFYGLKIGRSR